MQIENDIKLDFDDVLIKPKRSTLVSRSEVDLYREYTFKYGKPVYHGIPIIAANMSTIGTFEMQKALAEHGVMTALHKHYYEDEYVNFFKGANYPTFYTSGITDKNYERLVQLKEMLGDKMRYISIDVANGHMQALPDYISRLRDDPLFRDDVIMAGTVADGAMAEALVLAGADIVRAGLGGGSVCTTRVLTGIGMPQLSLVMEVADSVHGLDAHMVSDGGHRIPADIAKAFGAGADFVMLGGMLAGHDECGGRICDKDGLPLNGKYDGDKTMEFYGMSSTTAQENFNGGVAKHRASEGKKVLVPYRGPVENTVLKILGGLRSTCTYVGAKKLKELSKRTTFVRVNNTHNTYFGDDWLND